MRSSFLFFSVLTLLLLASCKEEEQDISINIPATPLLDNMTGWVAVSDPYVRLSANPDDDQDIVTTLRQGDILKVQAIKILKSSNGRETTLWYEVSWADHDGWVSEKSVEGYESEDKAITASQKLMNTEDK